MAINGAVVGTRGPTVPLISQCYKELHNKPEAVYSEMNDGQDSKEPEYMDISKSGQSTEQAGKIIMQDNPAYSAENQAN